MLSLGPRKAQWIIALSLVCLVVGAVMVCQVHTIPPDHGHAQPGHSHPSSSAHSLLDSFCVGVVAVLPTLVLFAALRFQVLRATPLLVKHTVFAFPPFIPPRPITR